MRPAILAGSVALPLERINVAALKRACTVKHWEMGAEEPTLIKAFREDLRGRYLHVPRQLGLQVCRREGIEYEDRTSFGVEVAYPRIPNPRDYQVDPLEDIDACFDTYYDFVFRARTGWGKTVGSLYAAARRGVSVLVIVDQDNLKAQWIETLQTHFGLTPDKIGSIQGDTCKFAGCAVTIAMVQTLTQRRFPDEVTGYFGMVIVDECHTIGAPTFQRVLMDFPAVYRWGVSATPKRRDQMQKLIDYHLGKVRVFVADQHSESSVYIAEHDQVYSWYANTSPKTGRYITEVTNDGARNLLIARAVMHLYETGRDVLVLSDRIEHLKHLMNLCFYLGLEDTDAGLYAGYNPSYKYAKDPVPHRRPAGYMRGAEYTPISLQLIATRLKKDRLKHVKENSPVIFATYGMFQKGVDVPRLSGGVDASPRSTAEQVHGRILRELEGKLRSIWITIADTRTYRSLRALAGRLKDYEGNNARAYRWSPDTEELIECPVETLEAEYLSEVARLKSLRIETSSDGLNTLLTRSSRRDSVRQRVNAIEQARQRNQPVSRMVSSRGAKNARSPVNPSTIRRSGSPSLSRRPQRRSGSR